jgi:pimeloyl-ACP methyl ester carboxylesterase
VYSDRSWLRGERLREKLAVTRARGARFSSVRFVTGKLDLLYTPPEFLDLARRSKIPMLMIYGGQTPSRSLREMEALTAVAGVQVVCLPKGKLSVHEECHNPVADTIETFLADSR